MKHSQCKAVDPLGLFDGQPVDRKTLLERTLLCAELFSDIIDFLDFPHDSIHEHLSMDVDSDPTDSRLLVTTVADRIYCAYVSELSQNGISLATGGANDLH
jgi:hypothetical protein